MMIFLIIVTCLLFRHDDEKDKVDREKPNKIIPDTEKTLPPSTSPVFTFKHAAITTDSQACSDLAR